MSKDNISSGIKLLPRKSLQCVLNKTISKIHRLKRVRVTIKASYTIFNVLFAKDYNLSHGITPNTRLWLNNVNIFQKIKILRKKLNKE